MKHVAWASDIDDNALEQIGGKGANLAEMMSVGLPVPTAFFVTSEAFELFIAESGIEKKIRGLMDEVDVDDNTALEEAAERAQALIEDSEIPAPVREAIEEAYGQLDEEEDADVAIRSSATAEDLPEASFAGQQETFLHVAGVDEVMEAVKACWASLYTPRAIYYRVKNDFPHEKVHMGVVVQRMVDADAAGVVFTRHPTTGDDEIIVEAAWGLGEGVVSGRVSPDNYVLSRGGELQEEAIAAKKTEIVHDPGAGGTIERDIEEPRRSQRVLSEEQLGRLAGLARTLDDHYEAAQDIEWAFEDGELFVLQTRPVTTIEETSEMDGQGKQEETAEILIEGLGASPGKGSGPVARLDGAEDLDRCGEGDILVTSMTTPDMVPAMRRTKAIVTDEGGMTCFPADTRVLTDEGILTMEEIRSRIGDEQLCALSIDPDTLELSWQPILTSMRREASIIEISISPKGEDTADPQEDASTADTLRLTPDHKMMIHEGTKLVERPIEEVLDGEQMLTVAEHIPAVDSSGRWPVPAYLVGALLADGHWQPSQTRGAVEVIEIGAEDERAFTDEIQAGVDGPIAGNVGQGTLDSESMIGDQNANSTSFGLDAQQRRPAALVKQTYHALGSLILRAREKELVSFLAGAVDGDGALGPDRKHLEISGSDRRVTSGLVLACLRLGIQPTVTPNPEGYENLHIRGRIGDILEESQRFGCLQAEAGEQGDQVVDPLLSIDDGVDDGARSLEDLKNPVDAPIRAQRTQMEDSLGVEDVYNLTVQENHNYVVFTDQLTPVWVANCHAAIVGRELGVPCVVGAGNATELLEDGQEVTVDGDRGTVTAGMLAPEATDEQQQASQPSSPAGPARVPTATEVKVNISMPEATERAWATDADGVGLLRVEHIVLGLGRHPMNVIEDDGGQAFASYLEDGIRGVAEAFEPRPVWVRTLDAPTDEFRQLPGGEREPHEANPMLGWRGIRRDLTQPELLEAQFEAIRRLRASGFRNVGVMLPLVQHPSEIREAKHIARQAGLDPEAEDFSFGVMIETPASALIVDDLVDEGLDFVSFGTNDLTQYTMAVDRNNGNVADLFDEFHPAVGRLIKHVIEVCNERDVDTSICGQAGSDPKFAAKLVEWGISSISANIDAVDRVRQTVAREEQRMILEDVRQRR